MQSENNFSMRSATRQKLLQMDIVGDIQKGFSSNVLVIATMFFIGLALIAIGTVLDLFVEGDWAYIVTLIAWGLGVIFIILIFPAVSLRKKARTNQLAKIERFKNRHGSYEKAENEIKSLLQNENSPAYDISIEDSHFYIIGDWYLSTLTRDLLHTSEIVAIVGIMGKGTFLILDDGTTIEVMFGSDTWDAVFGLFMQCNPHILDSSDEITISGETIVNINTAFEMNEFAAITNAYLKKKELQE
ncbi:MAG: hypothetical protein FWB96_12805 [Defluviitaleaceae bacterium]|nr:hypothetical protein [Defluviitaleaceae bacterium]MCL2264038.1 hypothetical protein [Defluviitaleaceae bacterium]